jgi:hypothetical protein
MLLGGELKPHTRLLVDVEAGELAFRADGEKESAARADAGE